MRLIRLLMTLGTTFAALASLSPAAAGPMQHEVKCPSTIISKITQDRMAKGETYPDPYIFVPAPLLGGSLYCTDEFTKGGGSMFTVGKSYWQLHERGTHDGVPYRIDYYKGWAEIFLGERAKPDRRTSSLGDDGQKYFADIVCRYDPYPDYPAAHTKHLVTGNTTCAVFATDNGEVVFYFTEHANAVMLSSLLGSIFGGIIVPGEDGYLALPARHKLSWFDLDSYSFAFKHYLAQDRIVGLTDPANERHMFISQDDDPVVPKMLGAIISQDHFLVSNTSSEPTLENPRNYDKIPTQRLATAMKIMPTVAQKMIEAGK